MKFCCADCAGDRYLAGQIQLSPEGIGTCDYCGTDSVPIISIDSLRDQFEFLMSIYEEQPGPPGRTIVKCLIDDWNIFTDRDEIASLSLLSDVLEDNKLESKFYTPSTLSDLSPKDKWISFREELVKEHRFFPRNQPNRQNLPVLFDYLKETVAGNVHRARICEGNTLFEASQMGPPPPRRTRGGRANPVGISYFYAASNRPTAIAETRPHTGSVVAIARFKLARPLTVVNLINPRALISPFETAYQEGDEDYLLQLRYDVEFLCHLGSELSEPVTPDMAELEYLPTQYLCELIKTSDFDGVKFNSSVGDGVNYVFFDAADAEYVDMVCHRIDSLRYESSEIR